MLIIFIIYNKSFLRKPIADVAFSWVPLKKIGRKKGRKLKAETLDFKSTFKGR